MSVDDQNSAQATAEPNEQLARLSAEFFQVKHTADPFSATLLGVSGLRRPGARPQPGGLAADTAKIWRTSNGGSGHRPRRPEPGRPDQPRGARRLAWGARSDLEHALWETRASADGYSAPQAMMFMSVPAASLTDAAAVEAYIAAADRAARVPRRGPRPLPRGQGRRPAPDPGRRGPGDRPAHRSPRAEPGR